MDMAIFENFFKLFCNLFCFFKILKRLFFRLFSPFLTTKRLKTDSRFDYLTVLKTTKAPVATPDPLPAPDFTSLSQAGPAVAGRP